MAGYFVSFICDTAHHHGPARSGLSRLNFTVFGLPNGCSMALKETGSGR